jgi:hypothetical protein
LGLIKVFVVGEREGAMALTNGHDVFASLNENGINKFIHNLALARPHYFVYATAGLGGGSAGVSLLPPLTVPGAGYGLNYGIRILPPVFDFYPQDAALPPPLVLGHNQFSIRTAARVCIDCMADRVKQIRGDGGSDGNKGKGDKPAPNDGKKVASKDLLCANLEVWGVGHPTVDPISPTDKYVGFAVDDIVVKGIGNFEAIAECIAVDVLNALLQKARYLVKRQVFGAFALFLADGPTIEDNQFKVWGTIG